MSHTAVRASPIPLRIRVCGAVLAKKLLEHRLCRRALVRCAARVHRAGGHPRGVRITLPLVVLHLAVGCAAVAVICCSAETFPAGKSHDAVSASFPAPLRIRVCGVLLVRLTLMLG